MLMFVWLAGLPGNPAAAQSATNKIASPPSAAADTPTPDNGTGAIDFYQKYLSSLRHGNCQFRPSCSEYAKQAIAYYGLVEGTARAADRLMRCHGSARRLYARGPDGRLLDPPSGQPSGRVQPRVPVWLLPELELAPPSTAVDVSFARSLATRGDCHRATTEYLRAAHLAATPAWHGWANLQAGACYLAAENWTLAESTFLEAGMLAANEPQAHLAEYLAAVCHFNAGRYGACRRILHAQLPTPAARDEQANPTQNSRACLLLGLCDLASGKWSRAEETFQTGLQTTADSSAAARMRFLLTRAEMGSELPQRSKGLATVLSIIVPGTGQMYAGRGQDGLRHLVSNGALI